MHEVVSLHLFPEEQRRQEGNNLALRLYSVLCNLSVDVARACPNCGRAFPLFSLDALNLVVADSWVGTILAVGLKRYRKSVTGLNVPGNVDSLRLSLPFSNIKICT